MDKGYLKKYYFAKMNEKNIVVLTKTYSKRLDQLLHFHKLHLYLRHLIVFEKFKSPNKTTKD